MGALGSRLDGQRRADARDELDVPRRAEGGAAREAHRRRPADEALAPAPLGPSVTLSAGTSAETGTFHQSSPDRGRTSSVTFSSLTLVVSPPSAFFLIGRLGR